MNNPDMNMYIFLSQKEIFGQNVRKGDKRQKNNFFFCVLSFLVYNILLKVCFQPLCTAIKNLPNVMLWGWLVRIKKFSAMYWDGELTKVYHCTQRWDLNGFSRLKTSKSHISMICFEWIQLQHCLFLLIYQPNCVKT